MTKDDFHRFAEAWVAAHELYGRTPSPAAVRLAFAALADQPIDAVMRALAAHLRDPKAGAYPPRPADVMRHITGGHEDERIAQAELAWRKVMEAVESAGYYASVVFDDPAIHYAIATAFGTDGWRALCTANEDELRWLKRDFVRCYLAYRPERPYPPRLVGEVERINRASGHGVPAPAYIGDRQRCMRVERGGRWLSAPVSIRQVARMEVGRA